MGDLIAFPLTRRARIRVLRAALLEAEGLVRARAAAMRAERAGQQVVCPARVARLQDALRSARAARLSEAGIIALCEAAEPECSLSEIVAAMRGEVSALRAQLASRGQRRDKRGARRSRARPSP